jgi:outer membrane beta-barrel protein
MKTSKMIRSSTVTTFALLSIGLVGTVTSRSSFADDTRNLKSTAAPTTNPGPATETDSEAERVNVDTIKEKYWARGDQSELGVVQNRAYTKAHKFELGVFGAVVATDPFLSVYAPGLTLGYHLSEYIAIQALYIKDFVGPSSALSTLQKDLTSQNSGNSTGANTSTNPPRYYAGGEVVGSILYGKLSVLGQAIIYYDMNVLLGVGMTDTQNGNYVTEHVGLGQQVYLSKRLSVKFDYRLMHYTETIYDTVIPLGAAGYHADLGNRANWTNVFALGVSFLLGSDEQTRNSAPSRPSSSPSNGGFRQ